jgi:hypothetical protein
MRQLRRYELRDACDDLCDRPDVEDHRTAAQLSVPHYQLEEAINRVYQGLHDRWGIDTRAIDNTPPVTGIEGIEI